MADEQDGSGPESELEKGIKSLGAVVETVTGRLLGERVIGKELPPDRVAISPEADQALARAGEGIGRLLHAAGEGLKAAPLRPDEALRVAKEHRDDDLEPPEGLTPLSAGLLDLGGGLMKVAEGVLDVVAPRKPKAPDDDAAG